MYLGISLFVVSMFSCCLVHLVQSHSPLPTPCSLPVYKSNDQVKEYCSEFLRRTKELLYNPGQLAVQIRNFVVK